MQVQHQPHAGAAWIETFKRFIQPDWHDLVAGEWATKVATGTWSTNAMRGWFLQLYPFIHRPRSLREHGPRMRCAVGSYNFIRSFIASLNSWPKRSSKWTMNIRGPSSSTIFGSRKRMPNTGSGWAK